jgi:peroxiredoxin Q/BCP
MSGKPIGDFEVPATGNQRFASAAFRGHPYVIYFYPKDATPGCTLEGAQFRDLHKEFQQAGVMVLGVSRDSVASHEKFKANMQFPFELLSDADEKVCKLFDVIKEKNMYGKKVVGIQRSTFLMGPNNEITKEWRGVKVEGHAAAVLAAAKSAAKSVS